MRRSPRAARNDEEPHTQHSHRLPRATTRPSRAARSIAAAAIVLFALACSGPRHAESPRSMETARGAAGTQGPADPAAPSAAQTSSALRKIIRTASVTLVVNDSEAALTRIVALVESRGGYVAEQRQWRQDSQVRCTAVLRVPAQHLFAILPEIRKGSVRLEDESVTGEDVSQEFVDLQAQLTNLRATETELRELLGTIRERTQQAAQVLEVYEKLSQVRSQIERMQGRMQFIDQMVAMSTIKLALVPDALAQPIVEPGWRPSAIARSAARALVQSLKGLAGMLIWWLVLVLPLGLILLAFVHLMKWLLRLVRRGRRPAEPPSELRER